jgi:multiple sugar transport system substrate-binding protein
MDRRKAISTAGKVIGGVIGVAAIGGAAYVASQALQPAPTTVVTTVTQPTVTTVTQAPSTVVTTVTQPTVVTTEVVTTQVVTTTEVTTTVAPPPKEEEFKVDKGPITVLSIQDPFFFPLQELVPEFEAETGIKVNFQGIAYQELHAKAVNSFITKSPGIDVVTVDNMWLGEWANNGWLVQLDWLIERDAKEIDFLDFIPNVIYSLSEWMGHIWTMPIACYSQNVIYRVDVLKKLGLEPPPKKPEDTDWWTWDVYMDYVKQINNNPAANELDLTGAGRMFGTVICGVQPAPIVHMYTQLAASKGVRWFKSFPEVSPDTGQWDFTPLINSAENLDSLNYYIELYNNSPPESINFVWFDAGTAFGRGNIGIFYWWAPYNYLVNKAGYMVKEDSAVGKDGKIDLDKYDIGLLPHQPGYTQTYSVSAWSFAIDPYSEHKGAAWEFIKWATSAETQKKMGLATEPSPYQFSDFSRFSLYKDKELIEVYPYLPTQLHTYVGWEGVIASGKYTRPCMPHYFTLEGLYGLQLNKAVDAKITPEEALATTELEWTNVLTQSGYLPTPVIPSYHDTLERTIELMQKLG